MRTIFTVFAMLISATAFACPQLSGSYDCHYANGNRTPFNISQGPDGYTIGNILVVPDNIAHKAAEHPEFKQGTIRGWCEGDVTLKVEIRGQVFTDGKFHGNLVSEFILEKTATGLKQSANGTVVGVNGSKQAFAEQSVCTLIVP